MNAEALSPLETACRAADGSSRLAQALSERVGKTISKASISRWKKERVPAEYCPDIEAITGVRCEELRPDVNWAVLRNQAGTDAAPAAEPEQKVA